jgi:spore germination protein GerM
VGLVLLGILVVFGVGYWVKNYYKPAEKAAEPVAAATSTPAPKQNTAPAVQAPAPSTNPAPAKPAEQQAAPADPEKQARDGRSQIDRAAGAAQTMLLPVYYSDGLSAGDTLQPVEVRVPQSVSQVKAAVEQLLNAPEALKLYSGIPAGTKVLSVNYDSKTGVATVDLSTEARQVQAGDVARVRAEFVYTLTRVPGVKAVQLWVLGHPAMLHEWQWSKPLTEADVQGFKVEPLIKFVPKS